jgi:hypothetical protein
VTGRPAKAVKTVPPVATPPPAAKAAAGRAATATTRPRRPLVLEIETDDQADGPLAGVPNSSLDVTHGRVPGRRQTSSEEVPQMRGAHTDPNVVAGDLDADWNSAYSVGDEAPGGDNPTPGQDVVDLIGRSLGVEYEDHEELAGGDEIVQRDRKRWELDPASSEDWNERKR